MISISKTEKETNPSCYHELSRDLSSIYQAYFPSKRSDPTFEVKKNEKRRRRSEADGESSRHIGALKIQS